MAATVSIIQRTSTDTDTVITNLRHNTDDTANPGVTHPLVRPSAGSNYGYWKTIFLNADTSPSSSIDNIKFFTDGDIGWTGATLYVGTDASYTEATGTPGVTGDVSLVATNDASTYTSASPLSVGGSISNPDTGQISDFIVLQVKVETTAEAGLLAPETLTIRYDEV